MSRGYEDGLSPADASMSRAQLKRARDDIELWILPKAAHAPPPTEHAATRPSEL